MTNPFCPHRNRNCTPSTLCTPCNGGGMLRDGEQMIVPMMLRDSMHQAAQRAINESRVTVTDDVRAQARADHEQWKRQGSPNAGAPVARSAQASDAGLRDAALASRKALIDASHRYAASPSGRAYQQMVDDLSRRD